MELKTQPARASSVPKSMASDSVTPLFAVPAAIVGLGSGWMALAMRHYEKTTGRPFYGLAGYHYSVPEWGFRFHHGGELIAKWTVVYPPNLVFLGLLTAAVLFTVWRRKERGQIALIWFTHIVAALTFLPLAAWSWVNVMGVFI
jgi:hypothetical protein